MLARGGRESNPPLGKKHRCDLGRGGWVTKTGRENCEEPGVGRWKSAERRLLSWFTFSVVVDARKCLGGKRLSASAGRGHLCRALLGASGTISEWLVWMGELAGSAS